MPTLAERIAPHLTMLRRYSRAVTGSQASGDAYVSAVLEALIADISVFPQTTSDRVGLFRLFAVMFESTNIEVPESDSPYSWERRAAQNL